MGLRNDRWIREQAALGMITPFEPQQVRSVEGRGVISYGVSSYGYDIRVRDEWLVFTNIWNGVIDPKEFRSENVIKQVGDSCVIPPNSFILAGTVEKFKIPRDTLVICIGKSTYCRCGLVVNISPLEPEWEGHLTVEISNTTPLPARVYANEGIAQLIFFTADQTCETSYADRGGKYQLQPGIVLPVV